MVCIVCGSKTQVSNSRPQKRSNQVWRRRECISCHAIFTTEESVDFGATLVVKSASGSLEPFSRDKLFLSLYKVCQHRQTALGDAKGLTDTVISKLSNVAQNGTLQTSQIIQIAQVALNRFDSVASVSYSAFHK